MKSLSLADLSQFKHTLAVRRIPLINSLLVIIIVYYLLKLTVAWLPPAPIKMDDDPLLMSSQSVKPVPQIARLHLFGVYQMNDATFLPIAQLGLTLQGILYDSIPANSQAIIASANGIAKTYVIGDTINGATIKQILQNDVVLETGGLLQRLTLIRPKLDLTNAP